MEKHHIWQCLILQSNGIKINPRNRINPREEMKGDVQKFYGHLEYNNGKFMVFQYNGIYVDLPLTTDQIEDFENLLDNPVMVICWAEMYVDIVVKKVYDIMLWPVGGVAESIDAIRDALKESEQ